MKKIASIDIGSNTLRLLVLEQGPNGDFHELDSDRVITRLGEGMDTEKRLLEDRIQLTLSALSRFRDTCLKHGSIPIHAVATSAVREAANREEFLRRAREETGLDIQVIPWEEEARLTLEGVFWKIPDEGKKNLTFDIGGGSTEFILSDGRTPVASVGTPLGIVRLTEKFISRHPVAPEEYRSLTNYLRTELSKVKKDLSAFSPERLIGTAGTVTTLAALDGNIYPYDPEKIHGWVLSHDRVRELLDDLKQKTTEERLRLKTIEKGREDLIIGGAALVLETMSAFGCDRLTVSEHSLREGILLQALRQA